MAVVDISVTEAAAEVFVGPVEWDDAPDECPETVIEHGFEVCFDSALDIDR